MNQKTSKFLKMLLLLVLAAPSTYAYKVFFNKVICINTYRRMMRDEEEGVKRSILTAFKFDSNRGQKGDVWKDELTMYWDNKKSADVPYLSESHMSKFTGSEEGKHEHFYITYKDQAREGMVLPLFGGQKVLFSNAHWLPTPQEGNPSIIGQNFIRYYLWGANSVLPDYQINYFSIDLPSMVNKGPQLVLVTKPYNRTDPKGITSRGTAIYVIEYEVKP